MNSSASSAKQIGSGASSHHSGNTRFLIVIEPSRALCTVMTVPYQTSTRLAAKPMMSAAASHIQASRGGMMTSIMSMRTCWPRRNSQGAVSNVMR